MLNPDTIAIDIRERASSDPESLLVAELADFATSGLAQRLLVVSYRYNNYWLSESNDSALLALYYLCDSEPGVSRIAVAQADSLSMLWQQLPSSVHRELLNVEAKQCFERLCLALELPHFSPDDPLVLQPLAIDKPWGQEIWFTGIERRGVARVAGQGFNQSLPWLLSTMPSRLCCGRERTLILLKILAPSAAEVYGDLYFELHEEKREVYVVTGVDAVAWPDGVGAIRFGFDPARVAEYDSEPAFKRAFGDAVRRYEQCRRQIDTELERLARVESLVVEQGLSADTQLRLMQALPEALRRQEFELRANMEAFTQRLPLRLGDVVKVPPYTPHSLQHGVRTVEFQTPVYERLILSFAQKVLTQDHWDTDRALDCMQLQAADDGHVDQKVDEGGAQRERIVDFDDFEVQRIVLAPGKACCLEPSSDYRLIMAVAGRLLLSGGCELLPEQAALLPVSWIGCELSNDSAEMLCFLLASPK